MDDLGGKNPIFWETPIIFTKVLMFQLPISASGCHAHWTLIFRRPQKAPRGYREDVSGTGIYNFQVAHRKAYKRHCNSHVGKVCI